MQLSWPVVGAILALLSAVPSAEAVRAHEFKKCDQSSFCRRLRRLGDSAPWASPYATPLNQGTPTLTRWDEDQAVLTFPVQSALHPEIEFEFGIRVHADGTARLRMDQVGERYSGFKRYDQAELWTLEKVPEPAPAGSVVVQDDKEGVTLLTFGSGAASALEIQHNPLRITALRDGVPQVVFNERGLLHMEHFRPKPDPFPSEHRDEEAEAKLVVQKRDALTAQGHDAAAAQQWAGFEAEDKGEWEETWVGRQDSKPKGPEALSLDISFPGYQHVFGLPEHASPLSLRETHGKNEGDFTDPYRLFNTDVFEYEADSPMSLYGAIPVVHAQKEGEAASIFWLNAAETWVDIDKTAQGTTTHFMSESGILDVLIYLEKDAARNMELFTRHTGRTAMPQLFALGFHQCRWNYLNPADVLDVSEKFDEFDIPMDVMWLDIEYSKDHMYGIWDRPTWDHPEEMVQGLDDKGRKLVIILDPHLKRTDNYFMYNEAEKLGVLVQNGDGKSTYEGWCWSGSASWLDMFHPKSWAWWQDTLALKARTAGKGLIDANARNVHVWNDMNEPAIFNGPEITSPKDVVHYGGWENRDIHNINGVLFMNNTAQGLMRREGLNHNELRRPFVLSRSFWTGAGRYGATWTGDNMGDWAHLAVSVPMILANSVGGMAFTGSDVGGFFGNPGDEMLVRWFENGILMPFFRSHAHIDTKRREPYLFTPWVRTAVRDLLRLRYKMLPVWYTAFHEAHITGLPIARAQYLVHPSDPLGFPIDDQYYIGTSGLLVKPPVSEGASSVSMYLADTQPYYHYFTHRVYRRTGAEGRVDVPAPLDGTTPMLLRGGSIVPLRERVRRSAELHAYDPFTLLVALGQDGTAAGTLYLDDGQTYAHEDGAFIWRRFTFDGHAIRSESELVKRNAEAPVDSPTPAYSQPPVDDNAFAAALDARGVRVERIIVLGLPKAPTSLDKASFTYTAATKDKASELVIKDPKLQLTADWSLQLL